MTFEDRLAGSLMGIVLCLALLSVVSLIAAAGAAFQQATWVPAIAIIDEATLVCRYHYNKTNSNTFDCDDGVASMRLRPRSTFQPDTVAVRGQLHFTTREGKEVSVRYYRESVEARDLKGGQRVSIKYNTRNPSAFELANTLDRKSPTALWIGLTSAIPPLLYLFFLWMGWRHPLKATNEPINRARRSSDIGDRKNYL